MKTLALGDCARPPTFAAHLHGADRRLAVVAVSSRDVHCIPFT